MLQDISEEQVIVEAREALLAAGHKMGETGDHWPVINDTISKMMKGWGDYCARKEHDEDMKPRLYEDLRNMEMDVEYCDPAVQPEIRAKLKELRELYDAYYTPLDPAASAPVREEELPDYAKRAVTILEMIEGG